MRMLPSLRYTTGTIASPIEALSPPVRCESISSLSAALSSDFTYAAKSPSKSALPDSVQILHRARVLVSPRRHTIHLPVLRPGNGPRGPVIQVASGATAEGRPGGIFDHQYATAAAPIRRQVPIRNPFPSRTTAEDFTDGTSPGLYSRGRRLRSCRTVGSWAESASRSNNSHPQPCSEAKRDYLELKRSWYPAGLRHPV